MPLFSETVNSIAKKRIDFFSKKNSLSIKKAFLTDISNEFTHTLDMYENTNNYDPVKIYESMLAGSIQTIQTKEARKKQLDQEIKAHEEKLTLVDVQDNKQIYHDSVSEDRSWVGFFGYTRKVFSCNVSVPLSCVNTWQSGGSLKDISAVKERESGIYSCTYESGYYCKGQTTVTCYCETKKHPDIVPLITSYRETIKSLAQDSKKLEQEIKADERDVEKMCSDFKNDKMNANLFLESLIMKKQSLFEQKKILQSKY
jgi:hypothetical protein